jgi:hypothetical protein
MSAWVKDYFDYFDAREWAYTWEILCGTWALVAEIERLQYWLSYHYGGDDLGIPDPWQLH